MCAILDFDQLRGDSHAIRSVGHVLPPDGPFQDIVDVELRADLGHRLFRSPVLHRRGTRDDTHAGKAGEPRRDFLSDPIGEVLVDGGAQVLEGKHQKLGGQRHARSPGIRFLPPARQPWQHVPRRPDSNRYHDRRGDQRQRTTRLQVRCAFAHRLCPVHSVGRDIERPG